MERSRSKVCVLYLALISFTVPSTIAQCLGCHVGPPDYMCPSPPSILEVYFPHNTYCTRFYKCRNGKAIEGRCPSGTFFNPQQNLCCQDESLCYRPNPCVMQVPGCGQCANKFVSSDLMASAFFVCNCDGTGVTTQCPTAFDPCGNATVTLQFTGGNCNPPTLATTTTTTEAPTTTTTTAAVTTTSTAAGTTTSAAANTTSAAAATTTTASSGTR
ncbi:spore coat protein SP65-like [Armigeres subalbatus]|uniref:spore coat protein SP65-like n=1 Tax=Armigeres subalbatus TaxID=124917 RepID=UPI002ED02365